MNPFLDQGQGELTELGLGSIGAIMIYWQNWTFETNLKQGYQSLYIPWPGAILALSIFLYYCASPCSSITADSNEMMVSDCNNIAMPEVPTQRKSPFFPLYTFCFSVLGALRALPRGLMR